MNFPSEINQVKVIYDDRDGAVAGWFARAYNDTWPLPDEWLDAETAEEAVDEARKCFGWDGEIEVYSSVLAGVPDSVIPAVQQ
jgi:hypothetical protein